MDKKESVYSFKMRDFFFLLIYVITMLAFFSCSGQSETDFNDDNKYKSLRQRMVETQIIRRNITDKNVLEAMRTVPRHLFVARRYRSEAYNDHPLPIDLFKSILYQRSSKSEPAPAIRRLSWAR